MRKIYFYLPLLFISFCVLFIYCTKNSSSSKRLSSQNVSSQVAPPPSAPAVLKKVCIQEGGNPVHCIKQVWQCTFDGYTLQWDINTNFVYPLQGPTGSLVGAPIPTVVGADVYNISYSGGSPFPSFLIVQWHAGDAIATFQNQINQYFAAVGSYEDSLNQDLHPKYFPSIGNLDVGLGKPVATTLSFKVVIYSFGANCSPTFAVTTLDWKPTTPKKCIAIE